MENITLIIVSAVVGILYLVTTGRMMFKTYNKFIIGSDKLGFLPALFYLPGQMVVGLIFFLLMHLNSLFKGISWDIENDEPEPGE
jgi:hypothetical protein